MNARARTVTPRERAWREIRRFEGSFTLRDLHARIAGAKIDSLRHVVHGLATEGLLSVVGEQDAGSVVAAKVYRCAKPTAILRPKTRIKDGLQQQLWTAMRSLRSWTIQDLAIRSSTDERPVSDETASTYVSALLKAGIVQVLQGRTSVIGEGSAPASYRLTPSANTGPAAPEVRRGRRVFDVNRQRWALRAPATRVSA